jgi:hypothetical protein
VAIMGEIAIRISFASRRGDRREWRRSGLTRTSIALQMVYLGLVCRHVQAWTDSILGFVIVQVLGLVLEVVVLVVGLES